MSLYYCLSKQRIKHSIGSIIFASAWKYKLLLSFSFEYEKEWLKTNFAFYLAPNLQMFSGRQYLPEDKANFGIFLDSSPNRWGRLLMKRREALIARQQARKETPLFETDYLLGVFDEQRLGGLRFKIEADGPYLNDNRFFATPPLDLTQRIGIRKQTIGR